LATDPQMPLEQRLRYFRAFDFQNAAQASPVLLGILREHVADTALATLALRHLDVELVKKTPDAKAALSKIMAGLQGDAYLEFADRYRLPEENNRLYQLILTGGNPRRAADILLKNPAGLAMFTKTVQNKRMETEAIQLLKAIRWSGGKDHLAILESVAFDRKRDEVLRRQATEWLGNSWNGEERILELLKAGKIEPRFIPAAVQGVSGAWRMSIRLEAATYLGNTDPKAAQKIPAMADLLALKGDVATGAPLFEQYCANCHQVSGKGIDYGPKLSEIGSKLPREGQYLAILHPNAGISFGYEGWEIKMRNGDKVTGLIASQTETNLVLKMPGGSLKTYKQAEVASRKQLPDSMMPAGFHMAMKEQELADLVEYLMTLKKN
jgi:putative heme-binding domain-containing protein